MAILDRLLGVSDAEAALVDTVPSLGWLLLVSWTAVFEFSFESVYFLYSVQLKRDLVDLVVDPFSYQAECEIYLVIDLLRQHLGSKLQIKAAESHNFRFASKL